MARPGSSACPEPISVALGVEDSGQIWVMYLPLGFGAGRSLPGDVSRKEMFFQGNQGAAGRRGYGS